jgi:isocitrate/isopropylmalate dehydrogenase
MARPAEARTMQNHTAAIIGGDGIGPEIADAALKVIEVSGAGG